jgi:hypothetical protein
VRFDKSWFEQMGWDKVVDILPEETLEDGAPSATIIFAMTWSDGRPDIHVPL